MNQPFQFEKNFEVLSFQIDPQGKLRWSCLADLMQEVAWRHADSRDFGQHLFEQGLMWVMSRFDINVHALPTWGEEIVVKTAGRGIDKLFALRAFEVCNASGAVIASAMSAWLLLDMHTKRPQRPDKVLPKELFASVNELHLTPAKIQLATNHQVVGTIEVRPSDLDMNNHVNNVSYIRWVEDFVREQKFNLHALRINYLAEVSAGQTIQLRCQQSGNELQIAGYLEEKAVFCSTIETTLED